MDDSEIADESRLSGDESGKRCANCGEAIDPSEWRPVATSEEDVKVYLFCDDDCRAEWRS